MKYTDRPLGMSNPGARGGAAPRGSRKGRARRSGVDFAQNRGGEQRNHDLVMASEGKTPRPLGPRGSFDHIDARPIVLDLIEVDGREPAEVGSQIARHRERLEE